MASPDLALFVHLLARPEAELDLAQAALVLAEPEYPALDIPHYLGRLDQLGEEARRRLEQPNPNGEPALRRVARFLHDQEGFSGNANDYYDPRDSFLNEVLDRRTGIPITLAVVMLEVAQRAGVKAYGVSFPGHFLLRAPGEQGPLFVDPFDGRLLGAVELRELHARTTGEDRDPDPRLLEPISKRHILARMLNNLRGIYTSRGDAARLKGTLERLAILTPSEELSAQLQQLEPPTRPPERMPN